MEADKKRSESQHVLRLFEPGDGDGPAGGAPSAEWTLGEFFDRWFLPIVLSAKRRSAHTIGLYRDSIAWWTLITGDPPLRLIDDFTVAKFTGELPDRTYRRGKTGCERKLAKFTIAKHSRHIHTILSRTGPKTHPKKPAAALFPAPPAIDVEQPKRMRPKPVFSMAEAQQLVSAAEKMQVPNIPGIRTAAWWHALLLLLFYTGLRSGTVIQLEYSMLRRRENGMWLEIPGEIVDKTSKPLDRFVHPAALAAIEAIRSDRRTIVPWPHDPRYLINRHERLQVLAGAPQKPLSPQAWRRTHGKEMARLGARYGLIVAQKSLDHEDDRTTSAFYVDLEAELIAQLPHLSTTSHDPQRRLFD